MYYNYPQIIKCVCSNNSQIIKYDDKSQIITYVTNNNSQIIKYILTINMSTCIQIISYIIIPPICSSFTIHDSSVDSEDKYDCALHSLFHMCKNTQPFHLLCQCFPSVCSIITIIFKCMVVSFYSGEICDSLYTCAQLTHIYIFC